MDPFTISALISGGVQLGTGVYQAIKSARIDGTRPNYEIPDEIKQNLTQAQINAIEGMPEDVRNRYIDQLTRTMATGLQALGDRRGGIAGVSNLVRAATDANRDIAGMDAQMRQQQEQALMGQRQVMANYKDKQWDWNERQKYLENAQAKQSMAGAAMQNITGAANNVMGGMMQGKYMDFLKGAYGGNTGNPMAKMSQGLEQGMAGNMFKQNQLAGQSAADFNPFQFTKPSQAMIPTNQYDYQSLFMPPVMPQGNMMQNEPYYNFGE